MYDCEKNLSIVNNLCSALPCLQKITLVFLQVVLKILTNENNQPAVVRGASLDDRFYVIVVLLRPL